MIGNRLKQLRENKGYNMRQMASALNLPYTTYVNYEKGEREPNSEQLILFSKYFGVSIDYIIGITDNIPPNRKDLDYIEEKQKGSDCCKLLNKCHNTEIFNAVELLVKLDTFDLGRIIGSIEEMLKAEKYTSRNPHSTTIYRAARSDDNHPAEIVETTKDFSKFPTTENQKL